MRILFFLFFLSFSLWALQIPDSLKADFTQEVTNEHNQTLTYAGSLFFKAPHHTKWQYETPEAKTICVNKERIIIIEEVLEQASIYKNTNHIKIQTLLEDAKQTGSNTYKTVFNDTTYRLSLKDDKLHTITFTDELNNKSRIRFTNVTYDDTVRDLNCDIPASYDIIRQ
ncbi:MAG: LolA-like outer membrane lipoprotein chaperone [Campylobacterota bacterium]